MAGNNSATTGGAGIYLAGSAPVISNNIAAFNTGGPTYANGMALLSAPASLSGNDVFGNDGADYSGQPDPTGSNGNTSVSDRFSFWYNASCSHHRLFTDLRRRN